MHKEIVLIYIYILNVEVSPVLQLRLSNARCWIDFLDFSVCFYGETFRREDNSGTCT